ncbi:septation protein A [Uliginosibacterium sp. H1]|uniref:septation protein A n=1 Tax=Uliginosibacterium sp. H1 TaxID=3114757 RepID=UPI002E171FCE|nr:septation protein A [Uliginosibacterium sp. H1]
MKLLLDFFPVVLFFVAYKFADIYTATGVAIVATLLQLAYAHFVLKKVEPMMWASLVIVVVFGGLTLVLHDPTFIKWKPTVLYWAMAGVLAGGALLGRNFLRQLMNGQLVLPDPVWARLNWAWVGFFALMGVLNIYIAYNFSEEAWVNFKLFGGMGLMFVFVLAQGFAIARYLPEDGK